MPRPSRRFTLLIIIWLGGLSTNAQRTYRPHSVLSVGNWYKIAVTTTGVYRLDVPFLQSLGIDLSAYSSGSIRVFGNGGKMLPEACNAPVTDDLQELAVSIHDGGDGRLNGGDYLLFYARGPSSWEYDSSLHQYKFHRNLFSNRAYYYIQVGSPSLQVQLQPPSSPGSRLIETFKDLFHYELDTFNFLSSGREWFGEEFMEAPGKTLSRSFSLPVFPPLVEGPAQLRIAVAGRGFGSPSAFKASVGANEVLVEIPPVATGPYDQFARTASGVLDLNGALNFPAVSLEFQPSSSNAQGWLDYLELSAQRRLAFNGQQLQFRNAGAVSVGSTGKFIISCPANDRDQLITWDVSDPGRPVQQNVTILDTGISFSDNLSVLKEYIAFTPSSASVPESLGRLPNQDLHREEILDYLVVAHPALMAEAGRLAEFHRQQQNLRVKVVSTDEVYNEFSSGIPDPTAIRDFVKMHYDRGNGDSTRRPRYLLLFGDASFDYLSRIKNNTNLVPAYESKASLDPLSTYTSDDYFGFLDDGDDINGQGVNLLDIGIGRIPAQNPQQAKAYVDKFLDYHGPSSLGPWRNEFSFVADDEDNNLHLEDAELTIQSLDPFSTPYNNEKIYLDAFPQESTPSGSSYPQANLLVRNRMLQGNLVWNYNGHGGYRRLAEEVVLDQSVINSIKNINRLPLFITATCDVAPFDNPLVNSIGENLLLRENTGAIALMTTTRLVFASSNRVMNQEYVQTLVKKNIGGEHLALGDAGRWAKNRVYQFYGDVINNRKFTLLGDPAMKLAFPQHQVVTTQINGKPLSAADTLKALSKYSIEGELRSNNGQLLEGFNGTLYPLLFEKPTEMRTLGNDPGSIPAMVKVQKNRIFTGKVAVKSGRFRFEFVVPKDIGYEFGKGRLSYYADNGKEDANGVTNSLLVGGTGGGSDDKEGPSIKAFLNDEKFINGGISNQQPVLLLKLADSSGINILGRGIGHDLVAMLDNDPSKEFVLNDFYQADLDDYQRGTARFQLPSMEEGSHTLTIRAWDVANNASEATLDFRVLNSSQLKLEHVLNYPNPFTTRTSFWFDHNRPGESLMVDIQVFTVTGRLVKTIRSTIFSMGNRSSEVEWDGKDDFGGKLGRGVYIYNLRVRTSDGKSAHKIEKLFLL